MSNSQKAIIMIFSYDIETFGLDARESSFICGTLTDSEMKSEQFTNPKEMWNRIIEIGNKLEKQKKTMQLYSFSNYDFYGIFDRNDNQIEYLCFSPFIVIRRNIYFIDFSLIMRGTVKELGEKVGLSKLDRPKEIMNEKKTLSFEELNKIKEYNRIDSEIVMKALLELKKELKSEGLNPKRILTIGQIGINYVLKELAKTKEADKIFKWKERYELIETKNKEHLHKAYRGGVVKAWKKGIFNKCYYYDINSSYPKSMTEIPFPNLISELTIEKPLDYMKQKELLEKMGVSTVIIYKPAKVFPYLLIRTEDENSELVEHSCIMYGTWTNLELAKAVEKGYKIKEVIKSTIYETMEINPLANIYEHLYKAREGNPIRKALYKGILNQSIGKFGQRREKFTSTKDSKERVLDYQAKGYEPIKEYDMDYLYKKSLGINYPKQYCPIIPSYVTACSRIRLLEVAEKIGKENLLYMDTDSIMTQNDFRKEFDLGNELGQWKIEYENENSIIYGKKDYSIGEQIKLSGFRKKGLNLEDFKKGKAKNTKMIGFWEAKSLDEIGAFKTIDVDLIEQSKKEIEREKEFKLEKVLIDYEERKEINGNIELMKRLLDYAKSI